MKRQSITQYIRANFEEGSQPSRSTVIRWLEKGDILGVKIGRKWFVYCENPSGDQGLADLFDEFDKEAANYADGQAA